MGQNEHDLDISRRNVGALLGALGGAVGLAALAGCAESAGASEEALGTTEQPLTGSGATNTLTIANTGGILSGATTVTVTPSLSTAQSAAFAGRVWLALEPYSSRCEVVAVTAAAGSTLTFSPSTTRSHAKGALVAVLEEGVLTPQLFGAVGDGATDDTAAIQAAVAAKDAAGLGTLYFPAGNYLCSSSVDFGTAACLVRGEGWASNNLALSAKDNHGSFLYSSVTSGYAFTIGNMPASANTIQLGITLRDIAFVSTLGGPLPSGTNATGLAIRPDVDQGTTAVVLDHVYIFGFAVGLNPGAVEECIFRDVVVTSNNTGIFINGQLAGQPNSFNSNWFYAVNAEFNEIGIDLWAGSNVSFFGGIVQSNSQVGVRFRPVVVSGQSNGFLLDLAFHGVWFEGNNNGVFQSGPPGLGDFVFDASNESASNAIGLVNIAFHNCRSGSSGTIPFVRNTSQQEPSTYAKVKFYDCDMVGVTLQLPTWSHGCVVIGDVFTQIVDSGTSSAAPSVILGSVNFPTANSGLSYAQVGATLALAGATTATASPPAGGASPLPATPKGYLTVQINGSLQQIAYY